MATAHRHLELVSERPFVTLLGASVRQRAAITHAAAGEPVHIEPVGSVAELTMRDFENTDVLLVWDEGERIAEVTGQLEIVGSWSPIVAISDSPSVAQVVRAVKTGAFDYVHWTGDFVDVLRAVSAAQAARAHILPRRQRQMEAHRRLQLLTRRERQVLMGMAQGMTNKQIAEVLQIRPRTVEIHRAHMMAKIEANHSADAIRVALEASLEGHLLSRDPWSAPWSLDTPLAGDSDPGAN